ncbi:MAG TPA: choice-of-anchor V domain-containing protein [Bryobacteraceae bacterium]|nr:choice-of-anchor V domain-containing protein [Bryobacteraceae bacterium]
MKKSRNVVAAKIAVGLAVIPVLIYAYSTGPDPRHTGAPGDDPLACTTSGCHTGTALNGGGGNAQLTSSEGTTYTPGKAQTLTLTITDSKAHVYGFQMSARANSSPANTQAGDFTPGDSQIVLCDDGGLKGSKGCPAKSPVEFIEHFMPFRTNVISVTWTPPATNIGPVTIYAAANAANGDGNNTGDHIYTTKLQLSAAVSQPPPPPPPPTAINVSHDLVSLGIASHNIAPNTPALDATPLFQAAINYAAQNQLQTITADAGAYYFQSTNTNAGDRYLVLSGLQNLTIDLQGSDLYFQNPFLMGMDVENCQNLTLKNFTLDYQNLPFTQVQVTAVDATNAVISYSTLGNWQTPTFSSLDPSAPIYAFAFRNGALVPGTSRFQAANPAGANSVAIVNDGLPWTQQSVLGLIAAGDTLVLAPRSGGSSLNVNGGTNITLSHVSVYSSGSAGVKLSSANATLDHVSVVPRPGTDHLVSSNAYGVTLTDAANATLQFCTVRFTLDNGFSTYSSDGNASMANLVMQSNLVQDIVFSRGISLSGLSNASLTGNVVRRTPFAGIIGFGPLQGLTMTHNVVSDANGGTAPSAKDYAAVQIYSVDQNAQPITSQNNQNVTITNNYIANTPRTAIWVEETSGGDIENNFLVDVTTTPDDGLADYPAGAVSSFSNAVIVQNISNVTVPGNTTEAGTNLITILSGSTNVESAMAPGATALVMSAAVASDAAPTATITDSTGAVFQASVSVSQGQASFVVPQGCAPGAAQVEIDGAAGMLGRGTVLIDPAAL